MNISESRFDRIRKVINKAGLDGLFCRLSEHVLYFSGYWPHNHVGAVVVPAEGNPVLLLAEIEARFEFPRIPPSKNVEVITFPLESADVLRSPLDGLSAVLPGIFKKLSLEGKTIGIEESFEGTNIGIFQGEVKYPAKPTWEMLRKLFPTTKFVDGSSTLLELRSIKSEEEIEAIKLAIETAAFGFEAARNNVKPGMTETELASVIEGAIHSKGTGYKNVYQARGYAAVYTGARSALQWTHWANSTDRIIQEGDLIIIELGSFADGYWADLTRNIVVGEPTPKMKEVYKVTREAQRAAIDVVKPGVPISEMDKAARAVISKYGYDQYRTHGLGHGVGTAYHEGPPLHLTINRLLETGMVLTVEPGLYIEGMGGLRPEDMIVVRENGAEVLSKIVPSVL
jgi:Xaa-Pro aminopeptidase